MNFDFETRSGTAGTIEAASLAEARQRLSRQYGDKAIETVRGKLIGVGQPAAGDWNAFWTKVRALPSR